MMRPTIDTVTGPNRAASALVRFLATVPVPAAARRAAAWAAGCRVLGVEVDARMADFARWRGIEVEVAKFEE